ncbi:MULTISPECIES: TetR/AcrR family transcriptional regulator [unclassified Bacillus (in: firmicutes)]|uniref:TetR/AcrR family transcriptional regulator n=1 Tax=unclassified Bacillus (in: firmicutes) TaxID=185979 RepID=UPI002FFD6CA4
MTKNKIKDAALTLFSVNSYEETTLAKIAEMVGIKTPSIYAFYSNKEDLFLTVLHEVFSHHFQYIQDISDSISNDTAERKLFTILQEMHYYHLKEEEKTNFYRRYMLFPPKGLESRVQEEFLKSDRFLANLLNKIFTSAIQKGEVREIEVKSLTASFLCLMDGLFTQLFYYPKDIEALEWRLKTNWKIYWEGISK